MVRSADARAVDSRAGRRRHLAPKSPAPGGQRKPSRQVSGPAGSQGCGVEHSRAVQPAATRGDVGGNMRCANSARHLRREGDQRGLTLPATGPGEHDDRVATRAFRASDDNADQHQQSLGFVLFNCRRRDLFAGHGRVEGSCENLVSPAVIIASRIRRATRPPAPRDRHEEDLPVRRTTLSKPLIGALGDGTVEMGEVVRTTS